MCPHNEQKHMNLRLSLLAAPLASLLVQTPQQQRGLFIFGITGNLGRAITCQILKSSNKRDNEKFDFIHGTYLDRDELKRFENEIAAAFPNDTQLLKLYEFKNDGESIENILPRCSHVLITIPPIYDYNKNKYVDVVLEEMYEKCFSEISKVWVGYVSTTGVYGDHHGEWVTELSETKISDSSNKAYGYLQIEKRWTDLSNSNKNKFSLNIFRSAGIYSNEASALHTICRRGKPEPRNVAQNEVFTSRIHLSDASRAIISSMQRWNKCDENINNLDIYNLADNLPTPRSVVMEYALQLLENNFPHIVIKEDDRSNSNKSHRAKRRQTENKKVSGQKMLTELLGCYLLYPTYKEGLTSILETFSMDGITLLDNEDKL